MRAPSAITVASGSSNAAVSRGPGTNGRVRKAEAFAALARTSTDVEPANEEGSESVRSHSPGADWMTRRSPAVLSKRIGSDGGFPAASRALTCSRACGASARISIWSVDIEIVSAAPPFRAIAASATRSRASASAALTRTTPAWPGASESRASYNPGARSRRAERSPRLACRRMSAPARGAPSGVTATTYTGTVCARSALGTVSPRARCRVRAKGTWSGIACFPW